jgi:hypothetical protein
LINGIILKRRIYGQSVAIFFQVKHGYFFSDAISDIIRVLFFFKEVTYVRDTKTRIMSLMASLKKIRVLPEKIVKGLPVYPAFSIIR